MTFHDVHERTFGYAYRGQQEVEIVNLRVQAVGRVQPPSCAARSRAGAERAAAASEHAAGLVRGAAFVDCPIHARETLAPGMRSDRARGRRGVRLDHVVAPGLARCGSTAHRNLIMEKGADVAVAARPGSAPVTLEVIDGSIRSAELEIEAAVERTARSPMIRDQHDYRVALFDARGRKLTGRSYSALVEPVLEHFPVDEMQPGDVFFFNDPYNSAGGDRPRARPVHHRADLRRGTRDRLRQVFGHHDDVGGMVPGSLPVHATSSFQEGLLVPRSSSTTPGA